MKGRSARKGTACKFIIRGHRKDWQDGFGAVMTGEAMAAES